MNKLFVYGIFLGENNRQTYGMSNPHYAVVSGYATVNKGHSIVEAVHFGEDGLGLTGLIVDVDPKRWDDIDALEYGYDRIEITTNEGEKAWMYAAPEERYAD